MLCNLILLLCIYARNAMQGFHALCLGGVAKWQYIIYYIYLSN